MSLRRPGSVATIRIVEGPWLAGQAPDPTGFADAVDVGLAIERRAAKGAATADDLRRYHLAASAIARHARVTGTVVSAFDPSTLEIITCGRQISAGRLERGFHPPWTIEEHRHALLNLDDEAQEAAGPLIKAASEASALGFGYVITIDPGHLIPSRNAPSGGSRSVTTSDPQREVAAALEAGARHGDSTFAGDARRAPAVNSLRAETIRALRHGQPVSVGSGARHDVIAEVLRELVSPEVPSGRLRILYVDGSEAAPFATGGQFNPPIVGEKIRLGLMSMRHTEIDLDVDGYWFRNRLVSLPRTLAESDADCTEQSIATLSELTTAGVTNIEIVHTGFEPAVVGFYRAVSTWLRDRARPPVVVQPFYLVGHRDLKGTPWGGGLTEP